MNAGTIHRVERDELTSALEDVLTRHFGARQRLKRLRRRVSTYSSSCAIENLDVDLDSSPTFRLVFKNLSPAALLPGAQQVRPDFLYVPERESATYEKILRRRRLGTATYFGSLNSAAPERHWLFLERVNGRPLCQVGRMESWLQAARWLAKLHSQFDGLAVSKEQFGHLLWYDATFFRVWMERADKFVRDSRSHTAPGIRRKFDNFASRYDRLALRIRELPRTLIHGEFYPSNILVGGTEVGRICPVDWELAGVASGLIDLAALTGGEWTTADRRKMIEAYRAALEPANGWPPPFKELEEAVDWCQLHWAVRWLGWASDWTPPDQHTQDWLREAVRLAEKLAL